MLQPSNGAYIKDMQAAIDDDRTICCAGALMVEIQTRYPDARLLGMPLDELFGAKPEDVWVTCDALVWSMPLIKRDPTMAQLFCDLDVVAVEVVLETPKAFTASLELTPSLSKWIQTLKSMGAVYTSDFESEYYAETCEDVPRMQALKDATDEDSSRRSRRTRRSRRRLKAAGAAAAAGSEDLGAETWTSLGLSGGGELERLPASTFFGVLCIWAFFVAIGMARSVWDQHKEDGLGNSSLAHLKRSVSLAEGMLMHAIERSDHAKTAGSASPSEVWRYKKSVAAAQKILDLAQRALNKRGIKEGGQAEREASSQPVLVAPQVDTPDVGLNTNGLAEMKPPPDSNAAVLAAVLAAVQASDLQVTSQLRALTSQLVALEDKVQKAPMRVHKM